MPWLLFSSQFVGTGCTPCRPRAQALGAACPLHLDSATLWCNLFGSHALVLQPCVSLCPTLLAASGSAASLSVLSPQRTVSIRGYYRCLGGHRAIPTPTNKIWEKNTQTDRQADWLNCCARSCMQDAHSSRTTQCSAGLQEVRSPAKCRAAPLLGW